MTSAIPFHVVVIILFYSVVPWLVYTTWIVVYRLHFHPLAKFPGPKLAAVTGWYEFFFDIFKSPGGQYAYKIDDMHEKYGPIVRINPHELHVKDSKWAEVLYANPAQGARDKHKPTALIIGTPESVFGTTGHLIHRKRRIPVASFFSKSCIYNWEPFFHENIDVFLKALDQKLQSEGFAEMRSLFLAIATDNLTGFGFGKPLGLVNNAYSAREWYLTIRTIPKLTPLVRQFSWIIPIAVRLPSFFVRSVLPALAGIVLLREDMDKRSQEAIDTYQKRTRIERTRKEKGSDGRKNLFLTLLDSKVLSAIDKNADRLAQEGFMTIIAGSETTARTLTVACFHLLDNRDTALVRLKKELKEAIGPTDPHPSLQMLERLPWLTAVVKESLRITGLVTSRLPVISPRDPLVYGDFVIPPGTPVGMTLNDINLDPTIFDSPLVFKPERWLVAADQQKEMSKGFVPFGKGSRRCLGSNFAMAELYLIIARLFHSTDLELFETIRERDIDNCRDCFVGECAPDSPGVRVRYRQS